MGLFGWFKRRPTRKAPHETAYALLPEAHANLQKREFDRARMLLLQAVRYLDAINDPAYVNYVLSALSDTRLWKDHYSEAIEFFSEYLKHHPIDQIALWGRGTARWYSHLLPEAIEDYSQMLELAPEGISALSARGQILAERGDYKAALEDLNLALQLLPGDDAPDPGWQRSVEAYTRNGRAAALAGLDDFGRAIEEFEASIAMCPDNAWVYFNRAQAYDARGEREAALTDYQYSLAKDDPPLCPYKREHAQKRFQDLSELYS